MLNPNKFPVLSENHEYLIDNPDYSELYERLNVQIEDYIIVYSYIHDMIEVIKELVNYNSNSRKIFKNSLNEYLDYLSEEKKLKKILIVSFPHKNHLLKSYNINVSNYIDEVLEKSNDNRILHLNISNFTFSNKEIKNMQQQKLTHQK